MPNPMVLASFTAALFAAALIPGPAAAYCIAAGIDSRSGVSLLAPLGVALGKLVHLSVALLGAVWLAGVPGLVRIVLLVGAALFMVVEGVRRWRTAQPADGSVARGSMPRHKLLWRGFLVSLANPQSLASSIAIVPLFSGFGLSGAGWIAILAAGTAGVLLAYASYEVVAALVSRRMGDVVLGRVAGATYLAAATGLTVLAAV